ncbi:glycosyltransferase family 25 protein [Pantoea sp. LMR881]|uniref:glycosyltransferase family 25 protein n=1 Tax=Pantoea sp. LMR881 TaxID=3014336 RepID=UPI0022AF24A7|nr:glycosyltransferase family 25 protein [Pantoea sp. LMR881]MCZ4058658.1 glycosyltransferase family 25 protein [Pantoea sp. LMR881]
MKIFIINLKNSTERRAKMEQQLRLLGLDYVFTEAVEGNKLSSDEKTNATSTLNYAFLDGEIGCALSHQAIYAKMIADNIEQALILEDDVTLPENLKNILDSITFPSASAAIILLSRVNKYYSKPLHEVTAGYCLHKTQQATTAHSYIINKKV